MPNALTRLLTRRGYGVQSPFAYHIVRDIICETTPFYAYEALRRETGARKDEYFLRLLLRLANDLQPHLCKQFISIDPRDPAKANTIHEVQEKYIRAGCSRCTDITFRIHSNSTYRLAVADSTENALKALEQNALEPDGCIALIRSRRDKTLWQELLAHPAATLIFDIGGHHALVFRKEKMVRTHYHL